MRRKASVSATTSSRMGLFVHGVVKNRTRRRVPFDNPTTEIVTYTISDENHKNYYIDDFQPSSYYDIGETLEANVYIKPYMKKNGSPSYTLCIQKEYHAIRGEEF